MDYQFPTKNDKKGWIDAVRKALDNHQLEWSLDEDQGPGWWLLSGHCPRCKDPMDQLFPFGGVITKESRGVRIGGPGTSPDEVEIEIVCNCKGEHPKGDGHGCGFGRGLYVPVRRPDRPIRPE